MFTLIEVSTGNKRYLRIVAMRKNDAGQRRIHLAVERRDVRVRLVRLADGGGDAARDRRNIQVRIAQAVNRRVGANYARACGNGANKCVPIAPAHLGVVSDR